MNKSQRASSLKKINEIAKGIGEYPADQVQIRATNRIVDGLLVVDVEAYVTNPDMDYESGWFWADCFSVGKRGRII